jgi:hypothetical protein
MTAAHYDAHTSVIDLLSVSMNQEFPSLLLVICSKIEALSASVPVKA